ncbi:DrmE family protein [Natronobacterium gregoryi]|uniref:Uncharacterized protein n=2 Tax=Natronobacterium gregoryi TaxID=44930 RepID=L0AIX2_NATGS|nr:DrmE family protein [Natronobacterium gregoryi]AFZ73746.1 hypothetical protein Natgr_2594 [Natronobacterium gregoryi SP2]ELY65805.1 hypothetical protein C490_13536 [Natronobacterium gregoryi SP2]PLK19435.1 hypothetical protein CYV19_14820 [Natronobacterium gregoryi SP2]SFJ48160.1 hypothetical protein SAMN05443661_13323 [Natronobacterium gregoryi]
MDAVRPYANACEERTFLAGFLQDSIENSGDPFHLGDTELAIVEAALRAFEQQKSVVIHNPFPSESLSVAICAAYAYSQKPTTGGPNQPMLLLPSMGYVTRFDDFHHSRTLNPDSNAVNSLIRREVVRATSEVEDRWGLYTAPTNDTFVFDEDCPHLGAMFIDFRRPEWAEQSFDRIEEFCENHPDVPVVYYTDEEDAAFELTCDRLGVEPLRVTNDLLSTADVSNDPENGESDLTVQQRILSNGGVNVTYVSVVDEDFSELLEDFTMLKNKLQERDIAPLAVGRVYNLLTKQPFKPKYWTECVKGDGYYSDVPTYLDLIRTKSDQSDGVGGDLLSNYARVANTVQGHLNDHHALQNNVFNAMQNAARDERDTVFVVSNAAERDALMSAATGEGYAIPENVQLLEMGQLQPNPDRHHIFLFPPYSESYIYEFPPSKHIAYVHNAMWHRYVQTNSKRKMNGKATHESRAVGGNGGPGEITDFVFDIDEVEDDIERRLRQNPLSLITDDSGSESDDEDNGGGQTRPTRRFYLDNDETLDVTDGQHITTYDSSEAAIKRKVAKNVSAGDEILLVDSVADDIYDVLVDSVDSRETMRENFNTVENWREMLVSEMEARNLDDEDVLDELQERGSDLEDDRTIHDWRTGDRYGPGDAADVRRTLQIFRPQLEEAALEQVHGVVWESLKTIRTEHRRLGRDVRRAIEAEVNPSTSAEFNASVNEAMIKNVTRDIEKVTVTKITRLKYSE